jgi:beta-glucanase (GH16 family)
VDKPDLSDWHVAWLMWPESGGNCGGNGEIDFPEGRLSEEVGGFHHHAIVGCKQEEAKASGAKFTDWHTYTVEWTPTSMKYILDGKEVLSSTQGIPKQPMRWQLQTEIKDGAGEPTGNLLLDWVAVYKQQP